MRRAIALEVGHCGVMAVVLAVVMAGVLSVAMNSSAEARSWRALLSPGPVGASHADIEGDCDKCHTAFSGVPDEKCLYCHSGIAGRMDSGEGFHASVDEETCVACHSDHGGTDEALTRSAARSDFDHMRTGFPIDGEHERVDCESCHTASIADMNSGCVGCHEDPHGQTHGTTCSACHMSSGWPELTVPLSAHRISIHGGHEGLDCEDCHSGGTHLEATVPCAACHEEAHGGSDADCETCHRVEGFTPATFDHAACTCTLPAEHQTGACLGCHTDWNFVDTPTLCSECHAPEQTHKPLGECSQCHLATSWEKRGDFQHDRDSRFTLEASHLEVSCDGCHGDLSDFRAAPVTCDGCHAETGEDAHGDFGDCASCHDTGGFDDPHFDHATTGFPLTGKHARVACEDCHGGAAKGKANLELDRGPFRLTVLGESSVVYKLASSTNRDRSEISGAGRFAVAQHTTESGVRECVECHDDEHNGTVGNLCSDCHTTSEWTPSTFDVSRHSETQLPLDGAHAEIDCELCHLGGRLKPLSSDCAECHMDRHAGELGDDCAECHDATAFRPVPDFKHDVTGFTLEGPHENQECEACHGPERGPAVQSADNPTECQVCHEASHNNDLGTDCLTCHDLAPGANFTDARGMDFAHGKTGFPLVSRHKGLPCGDCHRAGQARPNARCAECHVDPHAGGMSPECEMCHRPDRWRLSRFDHSSSGWPLRGRHQVTPCASCHVNQRWVGVETDCYGCHALDAARAPRTESHAFGPTDCQECHGLWSWR